MFLTPSEIINNNLYRCGPIDYLTADPYDHIFLEVTKSGEKNYPPPAESGVVSLSNCSICSIPETCLLFLANVRKIRPPRACKQDVVTGPRRQLDHTGQNAKGQRSNDIFQAETQVCENSRIHENMRKTQHMSIMIALIIWISPIC